MTIGKDELGYVPIFSLLLGCLRFRRELRNALNTLKLETEKLAASHASLANQIRNEMEGSTTSQLNKQIEQRKALQNPLEKRFKSKQTQEAYLVKAREKWRKAERAALVRPARARREMRRDWGREGRQRLRRTG